MPRKQNAPIDWIWIWKPEFFLDRDGQESRLLPPGRSPGLVGTCHPDTEPGQIVILYRTKPKMDVAYLLRTLGPAMVNDAWRPRKGTRGAWNYMAECEVLARIDPAVSLRELKACRDLETWAPLRRSMQGSYFRVSPQESTALWTLLAGRVPPGSAVAGRPRPSSELPPESEIESAMVKRLKTVGRLLGRDLELWKAEDGTSGRQLPCREAGGRLDLLCIDRKTEDLVLLELKVVRADAGVFGQICSYLGWVRKHLAGRRSVHGLVLADGQDAAFRSALGAGASVGFHEIRPIAKKLKLIA